MCKSALVAIAVVAALIAVCYAGRQRREKFVSRQAMETYQQAAPLLRETNGRPTYTDYKGRVQSADPVQHADAKALWQKGAFTPENVQRHLLS